jgi:hypothetical protein
MARASAITRLRARALGLVATATTPLACGTVEQDPVQSGGSGQRGGSSGAGGIVVEYPPATGGSPFACTDLTGLTPGCDFVGFEATVQMANVLLVLDQSGSMSETPAGYTMNK